MTCARMFRARRSSTGTADELSGFAGWASTPGGPSFQPCPALCRVTPEGKVGAGEAALFIQVLGSGAAASDKRKALGVADGLNGEIDVQFWPAEVVWRRQFNVQNFSDCGTPEPRELSETVVPEYWGGRSVWSILSVRNNDDHPAKFPDELARRMVLLWGFGVVCDPFLGSGTTGAVCAELGLPFVGIERDRRLFDLACDRIAKVGAGDTAVQCELLPANVEVTGLDHRHKRREAGESCAGTECDVLKPPT